MKYALGIDFGTLSARALLVDIETGAEVATSVCDYVHGVIDNTLPTGEKLPPDWALQSPQDYLDALESTVPDVLSQAGAKADFWHSIGGMETEACLLTPTLRVSL